MRREAMPISAAFLARSVNAVAEPCAATVMISVLSPRVPVMFTSSGLPVGVIETFESPESTRKFCASLGPSTAPTVFDPLRRSTTVPAGRGGTAGAACGAGAGGWVTAAVTTGAGAASFGAGAGCAAAVCTGGLGAGSAGWAFAAATPCGAAVAAAWLAPWPLK